MWGGGVWGGGDIQHWIGLMAEIGSEPQGSIFTNKMEKMWRESCSQSAQTKSNQNLPIKHSFLAKPVYSTIACTWQRKYVRTAGSVYSKQHLKIFNENI